MVTRSDLTGALDIVHDIRISDQEKIEYSVFASGEIHKLVQVIVHC